MQRVKRSAMPMTRSRTNTQKSKAGLDVSLFGALPKFTLAGVAALSAAVNILYLTGSFFMLEVYDRVIPGRSVPTLIGLCILAALLYAFQGFVDVVRGRTLVRVGSAIDADLGPKIFRVVSERPLTAPASSDGLMLLRDLDNVRSFASGTGLPTFFDVPWTPFYVAICWAFHPLIGMAVLAGAILLFGLALLSEGQSRDPAKAAAIAGSARMGQAEGVRRNAEVVRGLGMSDRLAARWDEQRIDHSRAQQRASDVVLNLGGMSKALRMALQSGVMA